MKEFDLKDEIPLDKQEIIAKKNAEVSLIGTNKSPYKGARLWELDRKTLQVKEIEITFKAEVDIKGRSVVRGVTTVNRNNLHVWAINKENAYKKFRKILFKQLS